jgi:hypothetical protein
MTDRQDHGQPWPPQPYDPGAHQQRIAWQQYASRGQPWPQSTVPPGDFRLYEQQPSYRQPPCPLQPQYAPQPPASRQPAASPRPTPAPRRLPPYPAHLVRFLPGMLPRTRQRRGHSLGHYVYMGTHPVAMLIALSINAMIICVAVGGLAFVGAAWMIWAMLVTMAWLVQVAAAALRG